MFCFKNGDQSNTCKICAIRYSAGGEAIGKNLPDVDIYKQRIHISFKQKIIAKEFPNYFGYLQERLLDINAEKDVVIDFQNTKYVNQFCISKILITLYKVRKNKNIKIIFPAEFKGNKMLRYLYNLGMLDFIFKVKEFECWAGNERVSNYLEKNSFSECYDYAILPYFVFEEKIGIENSLRIEEIINEILTVVENYYSTRNQVEKYRQIESRVHLYLFEVIDNIFSHAYKDSDEKIAWFAVNIYNNYLPPYRVLNGTPEERKFENRITRLQREVPMSVYKDIHDRYFGGFNIFVDDIGKCIQGTYEEKNIENIYKDVYLNGSNKRKTINGLKLVADQIATNCDMLWAHDGRHWVSTSFVENNSIIRNDDSETNHYSHPAIKGLTYDIFVNLAKNSKEKKRTYEKFGCKVTLTIEQVKRAICESRKVQSDQNVFVDILNIKNKTKSFENVLNVKGKKIFYRPRATQKNKMGTELETRVISKLQEESFFDTLIVYDLNQTTLFQIRAVFENRDYVKGLIEHGIETIVLLTEESWIFCMKVIKNIFVMSRSKAVNYVLNNDIEKIYGAIFANDKWALREVLESSFSDYVFSGKIYWGFSEINEYIDIEKMIIDRAISDLIRKSIVRISGVLNETQKIVFLEKYMEMAFGVLVNEYKDKAVQNIYLGSIIMSGETERREAGDGDLKIYLFKHRECDLELSDKHLILFELPSIKRKSKTTIYRRILNTNRIEECSERSEEFKAYLEESYKKNIESIDYRFGFFNTGFFSIKKDYRLFNGYIDFVIEIIRIKLRKFDVIYINIGDQKLEREIKNELEEKAKKVVTNTEFRNIGKKVFVSTANKKEAQLIVNLGENLNLIDMMTDMNHSQIEIVYVPIFNNMQFEADLAKVIDSGYIPYLPMFYCENEALINDAKIEKFFGFVRTLNPHYRKELLLNDKRDKLRLPVDFTNEIISFYEHLVDNNSAISINLLSDVIQKNINGIMENKVEDGVIGGQYTILIKALLLQHSFIRLNNQNKAKIVSDILMFIKEYYKKIEDSIVTYLLVVIFKCVTLDDKRFDKLFSDEVGDSLLRCKSNQLSILFADIYNENYRFKYETELNEFFVSNDITIYYNMLSQLLFNNHGAIHDSRLDTIYKKIVENSDSITEEDIEGINNIVPNCISLLKLTKSYDHSIKREEELEREFNLYSSNINGNLSNIQKLLESLMECAKERFETINKEYVEDGISNYYSKVKDVLKRKEYAIKEEEISNFNFIIADDCNIDNDGHIERNINLYKDTLIFEELAYLLHNAHSHAYKPFSLSGNADKKYKVWVRAEIHDSYIMLRLFNSIEKGDNNVNNIIKAIQNKKRIGKTYLEKFNIHVVYNGNTKKMVDEKEDFDIFETQIEIPYFN